MNYDNSGVHQWHFRHDALEAFNSFSAARNLCFWATLLCILLIQGVFFSVSRGVIDPALDLPAKQPVKVIDNTDKEPDIKEINNLPQQENQMPNNFQSYGFTFCSYTSRLPEVMPEIIEIDLDTSPETAEKNIDEPTTASKKLENEKANAKMITSTLKKVISGANVVVVFSILMYSICLFFSIQFSLVGSLGGMSNSTKAFFPALLAGLLVIPWTQAISPDIPTSIFTFDQIVKHYTAKCNGQYGPYASLLYYGRFCGAWLVVLLLLFVSQWRSCQAVKQIILRAQDWKSNNPIEWKQSQKSENRTKSSEMTDSSDNSDMIPLA